MCWGLPTVHGKLIPGLAYNRFSHLVLPAQSLRFPATLHAITTKVSVPADHRLKLEAGAGIHGL